MRALLCVAFAGCAHAVPVATATDPELCFRDPTAPAVLVAPHGDRVGLCYGDGDCLVVDHARGVVVQRTGLIHPEQPPPPELRTKQRDERFEARRTETETSVCDRDGTCRTLRLPGLEDQRTVLPAISVNGAELYYVAREGDQAFLDTIGIDPRARRLGRVPLPVGHAQDHSYSVDRVGSAVLVTDSVSLGLNDDRSQRILVDPLTGALRALLDGSAGELDDETAIVLEKGRASIVQTRSLKTLTTRTTGGGMTAGISARVAVVAYANPPTIVVVENHRFTRTWRLPVCRP